MASLKQADHRRPVSRCPIAIADLLEEDWMKIRSPGHFRAWRWCQAGEKL